MSDETKIALDELKETLAALAKAVKEDGENGQKRDNILTELKERQDKLETARTRKGAFTGDEEDEEIIKKAKQHNVIGAMVATKSIDENVIQLQKMNDDVLIVSQLLGVDPKETKLFNDYTSANPFLRKAMDAGTATEGAEWVPTGYSPQLYDRIRLTLKCASLHPNIDMPTNPYKPPLVTSDTTGYLVAERTGDDDTLTAGYRIPASQVGTDNFTLTAKKIAGRTIFSEELSEDSIVPILPLVRQNIVISIASSIEKAIIDGDTAATQDSDNSTATDVRRSWNGYRKCAKTAAKVSIATFNGNTLSSVRKAMGKYGVNPSELAIVTGVSGYVQMLNLLDSNNNQLVTSLEKYGPNATILSGELARVYGMPIIVSEYVREDLNATGVYDATTTTKTLVMIVYKAGFLIGNRRQLTIKTAEDINTDQTILVATQRMAFSCIRTAASDTVIGLGYNLTA